MARCYQLLKHKSAIFEKILENREEAFLNTWHFSENLIMMFKQDCQRDLMTQYWVCDGSTQSNVNRFVFLLLLCTHFMYCSWLKQTFSYLLWKTAVTITSPQQSYVAEYSTCLCSRIDDVFMCMCVCVCSCASPMICRPSTESDEVCSSQSWIMTASHHILKKAKSSGRNGKRRDCFH